MAFIEEVVTMQCLLLPGIKTFHRLLFNILSIFGVNATILSKCHESKNKNHFP